MIPCEHPDHDHDEAIVPSCKPMLSEPRRPLCPLCELPVDVDDPNTITERGKRWHGSCWGVHDARRKAQGSDLAAGGYCAPGVLPVPWPTPTPAIPVDLLTDGLLWLINRRVFHPIGYALALTPDGTFELLGDGTTPWTFDPSHFDEPALLAATEAVFARARATVTPPPDDRPSPSRSTDHDPPASGGTPSP